MQTQLQERIERQSIPEPNSGCWIFTGSLRRDGYGQLGFGLNTKSAHRVAWEAYRGPIPPGMLVCHQCDNKVCCNPDHLFIGSQRDNIADMDRKGRRVVVAHQGEKHGRAKLRVEEIRFIRSSDITYRELAKKFGVSRALIGHIKTRRLWRHV